MNFLKKLFSKRVEKPVDLPPEFLQESPPDWLIDLKGKEADSGKNFSIRVQLFNESRTGTAEILILPLSTAESPKSEATELTRPEIDKLFVILGFSFPVEFDHVSANTDAGLPVNISIYRQEPFMVKSVDCNLAGWLDSKKSGPPAIEISRILLDAHQRALP